MRRILVLTLIGCLTVTIATTPASAGKRKKSKRVERTVEASYSTPAAAVAVSGVIYGACIPGDGIGCVEITPQPTELFARIKIDDALGQPVHAIIEGDTTIAEVCGETDKTVYLGSDDPFLVWIFAGPCGDGSPAIATSGTVTAVLSNLP